MIGLLIAAGLCLLAGGVAAALSVVNRGRRQPRSAETVPGSRRHLVLIALSAGVVLLGLAVLRLLVALATSDLRFAYVAAHTRPGTSIWLRLAGLWAGAEGSLLFFVFVLTAVSTGVWASGRSSTGRAALIGAMGAGLTGAVATVAYPFERLAAPPLTGSGVTPILEHPAMIVHPPLLYLGLALGLAPFVVERGAHRWALGAAAVLIAALGIGAWWAYVEVGWGGWWAWDPVENTALVVWLLMVAGFHSQKLAPWCYALAWPAVAVGTALTRTSLRTSVHAFADAAGLGWWLWATAGAVSVLVAAACYRHRHGAAGTPEAATDDGMRRLGAAAALVAAAAVIALGTYRPFVGGDATAGWFYTRTLYGPVVVGIVAVGVVPASRWSPAVVARVGAGILVGGGIGWWLSATSALVWYQWILAIACGIGIVVIVTDGRWQQRRSIPQLVAHLGVVIVALGALGSTAHRDTIVPLEVHERTDVAGHVVQVDAITATERTGIPGEVLRVRVDTTIDGDAVSTSFDVYPEKGINLIEVGSRSSFVTDVQVIFVSVDSADPDRPRAVLRIDVRPLNQLVWWGVALIAAATVTAAFGSQSRARGQRATPSGSDSQKVPST